MRLLAVGIVLAIASSLQAATYLVNGGGPGFDVLPGDGVCEATPGVGDCSLSGAIQEANAHVGPDTINVPAGTYVLSGIVLTDEVIVNGVGATQTIIDGNLQGTAVTIDGARATLSNLTVRRGVGSNVAGGISVNPSADLLITDCAILNNRASNVAGGVY